VVAKDVRKAVLAAAVEAENCGAPENIVGALERAVIDLAARPTPGGDPRDGVDRAAAALRVWEHWSAVHVVRQQRSAAQ
jgi:hypothetical protein